MRYRIAAVGRLRRGFFRDGCDHYQKRLEAYGKIEVIEVKEAKGEADAVRGAESAALLALSAGRLVAVDERGTAHRSLDLARRLTELELHGSSAVTLFIGGAEGLHESLRERADELWSLSPLTLPHELARLVLLEQLYRAETIRHGHPYHRE